MSNLREDLSRLCFSSPECKKSPYISHVLESFQQRYQMEQVVVSGIVDPTFDWYGIVCAIGQMNSWKQTVSNNLMHTFMKNIAHGAIVQNGHPAQIRLNAA